MAFGHFKRFLGSESVIGTDRAAFRKASEQLQSVVSRSADTLANSAESIIGTSRPALAAATSQLGNLATQSGDILANSAESIIGSSRVALDNASSQLGNITTQSADALASASESLIGTEKSVPPGFKMVDGILQHVGGDPQREDTIKHKNFTPTDSISPLSDLGSKIKHGLARTNRFEVHVNLPPILRGGEGTYLKYIPTVFRQQISSGPERFTFTVNAATLPGRSMALKDARTYGPVTRYPWDQTYTDVTLVFLVGRDMFEKRFFEAWHQSLFDPVTHNLNYYKEYTSQINIYQNDKTDMPIYGVALIEAYPSTIGDLSLSHDDVDNFHKLSVTFAFRKWLELENYGTSYETDTLISVTPGEELSSPDPGDWPTPPPQPNIEGPGLQYFNNSGLVK